MVSLKSDCFSDQCKGCLTTIAGAKEFFTSIVVDLDEVTYLS